MSGLRYDVSVRVLLVNDDEAVTASLALLLKQAGYGVVTAATPEEALARLGPDVGLVLQDMNFSRQTSGEEGLALLASLRARRPELPVILMTAWGSIALAVRGMKAGASDFVTKPWTNPQLLQSVKTALGLAEAGAERDTAAPAGRTAAPPSRAALDARYDLAELAGEDPRFLRVLDVVGRVAATDASVLVTGESGTGKELVAAALHANGARRAGPFVKVNLGGISSSLFESEMFGHVKGAFTDAQRDRVGRFTLAHGGTIFLDEIGDLDPASQVKLLRVLQDRTYEVLGSSATRTVDARVVSATNRNLGELVARGDFREDLLYRLNLIAVELPPLRERRGDVPILVDRFLRALAERYGRPELAVEPAAVRWLAGLPWPGNVRQLRHLLERTALVSERSTLGVEEFESTLAMERREPAGPEAAKPPAEAPPDGGTLDAMEKSMVERTLQRHGGNVSRAAEALGLSRAALYRRLEKYGIAP